MASGTSRPNKFSGCHPEVTPKSSPPGALPRWQLFDLPPAVGYHLFLHHCVRLRRFMRLQHYLRLEKEAREFTAGAQGRDVPGRHAARNPASARRT
jgi:hypothetical protein